MIDPEYALAVIPRAPRLVGVLGRTSRCLLAAVVVALLMELTFADFYFQVEFDLQRQAVLIYGGLASASLAGAAVAVLAGWCFALRRDMRRCLRAPAVRIHATITVGLFILWLVVIAFLSEPAQIAIHDPASAPWQVWLGSGLGMGVATSTLLLTGRAERVAGSDQQELPAPC